jgi:hypothetical protein
MAPPSCLTSIKTRPRAGLMMRMRMRKRDPMYRHIPALIFRDAAPRSIDLRRTIGSPAQ